jgi:uncharacterized cupin superfamily protein
VLLVQGFEVELLHAEGAEQEWCELRDGDGRLVEASGQVGTRVGDAAAAERGH